MSRRNSLNLIRLVLAATVIVGHTWPIGGYKGSVSLSGANVGAWAVAGFFGISGYLITISRRHHRLDRYLLRRAARILPGFWVNLAVTGLVFAPVVVHYGHGSTSLNAAGNYLEHNATLRMHTNHIGHTLSDVPFPRVWNGSLWTLYYEFACYLIIGLALIGAVSALRMRLTASVFLLLSIVGVELTSGDGLAANLVRLACPFAAGALIAAVRPRLDWRFALPAAVVALVAAKLGQFYPIAAPLLAYVLLYLGDALPQWCQRVGADNDISYGVYIYGFPVQQTLATWGLHRHVGPLLFALISLAGVLPWAAASWFLVEKPSLRLARLYDRVIEPGTRRLATATARLTPGRD
ncbi:acyltransferase [Jatrophihabitans telluris]|uniref:Acyltransferase n=1 Tax=Jatrophihabitans telluris TaxID=2038343 RepID=A0ABY4R2Y6_9ACTN|nr:acyltransferase [Jatrophihabitans telluris]UQX89842.1 acyltransferase [Jatrophihabitans telluris]